MQNQTNVQGTQQPKELPNYPIKRTARKGHNQKNCQGQCVSQTKGTLGTTTFEMTTREYHNQNDLKGVHVSLLKGIPGSITNQTTAREYDKSVFSGIITIKTV